jgi:hypothetical protein
MSSLLNKFKAKAGDHPNAVSEDTAHKPQSGVQDKPEGLKRAEYGQGDGRTVGDDGVTGQVAGEEVKGGSVSDPFVGGQVHKGTMHEPTALEGGEDAAKQAMQNVGVAK